MTVAGATWLKSTGVRECLPSERGRGKAADIPYRSQQTVERNAAFLFEEFWAMTTRQPSAERSCSCRGGGDGEGGGGGWGGNSWRK
jgi:hypothetical protein